MTFWGIVVALIIVIVFLAWREDRKFFDYDDEFFE